MPSLVAAIVVIGLLCWAFLLFRIWYREPPPAPRLVFPEVERLGQREPLFGEEDRLWPWPLFYLKHCRRPFDQSIDA